ncbi:MAG: hypothetical protein WD048_02370 [Chitinophagales bacterium]
MIKIAYVILVSLLVNACNNSKNINITSSTKNDGTDINYGLVVSFYSPGNGIDHKTKNKFVEFISNYKVKIDYEKASWGKEGEIDFCILLTDLTKQEKVDFIQESKDLLAKSSKVRVYENAPCRHKESP